MVDRDLFDFAQNVSSRLPGWEFKGVSSIFCNLYGPKGAEIRLRRFLDQPSSSAFLACVKIPPCKENKPFDLEFSPIIELDLRDAEECEKCLSHFAKEYEPLYSSMIDDQYVA